MLIPPASSLTAASASGSIPASGRPKWAWNRKEAQHAQPILEYAFPRRADETDAPFEKIAEAAERIHQRAVKFGVDCVHREVPPGGIVLNPVGKRNACTASVRFDVPPERRDLDRSFVADHHHGPEQDAVRGDADLGFAEGGQDGFRHGVGRDVKITDRQPREPRS